LLFFFSALNFNFCQKKQENEKLKFKAVWAAGEARFSYYRSSSFFLFEVGPPTWQSGFIQVEMPILGKMTAWSRYQPTTISPKIKYSIKNSFSAHGRNRYT
jgi:hypothetical protein